MYCPNCGCTNNDDAVVCENCGAKLENNSDVTVAGKNPNKEKKIIIILIIVLIIISIAAAGIIGAVAHKKSNNNNETDYPNAEEMVISGEAVNDETNNASEKEKPSTTKPQLTINENAGTTTKDATETTTKNNTTTQKNTTTTATTEKTTSKSTTTEKTTYTEYRYRDKSFKTSSNNSMSGWTLYDTTYSWSDYGSWSNWSTNSYSSSDSRQTESRTTYRFYVFRCTKCGNRDPYSTPCDNCKTSQYFVWEELWYPTKGNSMSKNTLSTVPDKYYVTINGARWWFEKDGYSDGQGGTGQPSRKEYRYRDRKQIATYHFYKWSEWSNWSTTPAKSSDTREVETRKVS